MNIKQFWKAVLAQNREAMRSYFNDDAYVNWHCTNEHFTVEEFIRANCEYPGEWDGEVERIESTGDIVITATHVYPTDKSMSFHVISFIRIKQNKITLVDEYWSDDGDIPQWRQENEHRKTNQVSMQN